MNYLRTFFNAAFFVLMGLAVVNIARPSTLSAICGGSYLCGQDGYTCTCVGQTAYSGSCSFNNQPCGPAGAYSCSCFVSGCVDIGDSNHTCSGSTQATCENPSCGSGRCRLPPRRPDGSCAFISFPTPTPAGTPTPAPLCGNGVCNSATESSCNCQVDCPGTCATPPPPGCSGGAYSGVQGPTCQNYGSMAECQAVSNDCKCGSCTGNISYHAIKMAIVYEDLNQNGIWDTTTEQRLSGASSWSVYGTPRSCTNAGPLPNITSTYVNGLGLNIDDNWNGLSGWVCSIGDDEIPFWLGCGNTGSCDYYAQIEHSCVHDSDCGAWPGAIRRFQPNFSTNTINSNQNIKNGPTFRFYTHNVENGGQVHQITVTAPTGWTITQVRKQDGVTNPLIPSYGCVGQSCNYDVVFDSAPADGCATGCDANFLTVGMRQVPIPSCTVTLSSVNIPINGTRTVFADITTTDQGTVQQAQATIPAANRASASFIDNTALQTPIDPLVLTNATTCTSQAGCNYNLYGYIPNIKGFISTAVPITSSVYVALTDTRANTNTVSINGTNFSYACSDNATVTVNSLAWWQATDADILLNGAFRSSLPTSSTRFDLVGPDNIAGVPSYSSASNADLGAGTYPTAISNQQWVINSNPTLPYPATNTRFDYAYLTNLGPQVTCPSTDLCYNTINNNSVTYGDLQAASATAPFRSQGYAWFRRTGDLTLQGGTFGISGRKYVLFVDGNVTINNDITLASPGSDLMLMIIRGDLAISPAVTRLDGIYIVSTNFIVGTNLPSGFDSALAINGSMVVWGNATLLRSLETNVSTPAESFNYKPQLLVSWPQALGRKLTDWKEVNP